jgi:hypothetical protein
MTQYQDPQQEYYSKKVAYDAAKAGGGGLLDYMTAIYSAIAPNAGAARLLQGINQVSNIHGYNKAQQAAAEAAYKRQALTDANNSLINYQRTGKQVSGPFDISLANSAAPDIRKDNSRQSRQDLIDGKKLTLSNYADYDPALERDYIKQQADATNYAMQNGGVNAINQGQKASMTYPGGNGAPPQQPGQFTKMPGGMQWDNGAGTTLNAGVQQTGGLRDYQAPIPMNVSPFTLPTDIPAQVAAGQRAGVDDAQTRAQQVETNRSNVVGEKETSLHNRTTEKETHLNNSENNGIGWYNAYSGRINANKPSGSEANPYTQLNGQQNYLQGQVKSIDDTLMARGYISKGKKDKNDVTFYKQKADNLPPEQWADYQSLLAKRRDLQAQIQAGGPPPAPTAFGGNSGAKLEASGSGFAKWKQGQQ